MWMAAAMLMSQERDVVGNPQVFYQRRTRGRGYSNWDREQDEIQNNIQILIQLPGSEWAQNFDIACVGQQPLCRRLKRETLREVRAQLVQRLAGAPSSRPADGGDDAIQPATQSDPERTTAQHSQQTLDVPVTTGTNMEQGGDWSPDIQHSSPSRFPLTWEVITYTADTKGAASSTRAPTAAWGTTAVPEYPVSAPSRRDQPMRRPPTSDEDTDGEQQSGPFVPELSTSTPPRRDEPLMELTSDEEDQDGEQQPEPLVLPVTKDGRETVQSLLDFAVPKVITPIRKTVQTYLHP
ncbi:hypothetical protein DPEC_G00377750 [Dallia pectoralis]|nr:hypothetical protein DPEC_G00377750 [Dallia pectoralis]